MARPDSGLAVASIAALQLAVGTASAHGLGDSGGTVGLPLVVGLAVGASVAAGVVAAIRGSDGPGFGRRWITGLVGPTLVILGAFAALTASRRGAFVAGGCLLTGAVLAWVLVRRFGDGHATHGACENTALGAVTVHRAVEGVSLAAVYATGSAVGLAGTVVLAGHSTAETAAVGGLFGVSSRSRAAVAVGVVQTAFLAGAIAGVVVTSGLPPLLGDGAVAVIGGVLLVVGVVETRLPLTPREPRSSDGSKS